ncbi:hypothetical protein, partial [uncultured Chryseobacterium sp.]|uniref:hypothetical protein n=1 Tax=uncultured Chryseobacterium sp. TaxID=259322 RepID=UPI0027DB01BB
LFVFLLSNFCVDFFSEINLIESKAIQYNYLNVFNIFFFIYFYYIQVKSKFLVVLISVSSIICICFTSHFFYFDKYNLSIAVLYCLANISYALYWIKEKLNNVSDNKITSEPLFWISISLLFWSCFFVFRIIPMYFLDEEDKQFLKLLKDILSLVNILVYILFYIGISKYKHIKNEIFTA